MKQKIKHLIAQFIGSLSPIEREISVHDLSIFFSVLIATVTIRRNKGEILQASFSSYDTEFTAELHLIKERFPDLFEIFELTKRRLRSELLSSMFEKLKQAFVKFDSDSDNIISWSYQFLKKDLEKAAFKKIGRNKAKIENSDLLFTTQFFTDKYMVEYLVDESLSGFSKEDIQKVIVIDCASGGGNFLNYSFEKLFLIYQKSFPKWSKQKVVDTILNEAILGYDLDSNLSRIAILSLFVKASAIAIPSKSTTIKVYGGLSNDKIGFLNTLVSSNVIDGTTFDSQLDRINKAGKIKVFVTNPPFMGKRDMDTSLKRFLSKAYPESKGDLCVSFLQKILQSMSDKDVLGVVSQNNWMFLSSLKHFRRFFLAKHTLRQCVDLGSNAFEDINGEKTSVALCIMGKSNSSRFVNLKNHDLSSKRRLVSTKEFSVQLTFELNQNQFLKNEKFEFNYQLEDRFENIKHLKRYAEFGNPMQGTSTGNNAEFVKFAWEVNGNADWRLVSKGGGFSKWVGLNYYKVNWGINAEKIKANKGSALRNLNKISSTQLVYSDTGTLGLNVRILKESQVFIASGPGIQVLHGDKYAHLAFLNSRIATFLLKVINPKFTISAGYISKIPIAPKILDSRFISTRSKKCLELKERYLKGKLPNFEFEHPDYFSITDINAYIEETILSDLENDFERLKLESEIEVEIIKQYQFSCKELVEIKSTVGESPFFNKNKLNRISIPDLDYLLSGNIDVNCLSKSRAINGYSVGSESIFEDLSYKLNVNPTSIIDSIRRNISMFKLTKAKYFNDFLHKIILSELGVKKITNYKFDVVNIACLVDQLQNNYTFLKAERDLMETVVSILSMHHKTSFFNKPLIVLSKDSLTVGQLHNE